MSGDPIQFTSSSDNYSCWDNINYLFNVPTPGYYHVQCCVTIDTTSSSNTILQVTLNRNSVDISNFLLTLNSGYGTYTGSGFYVLNCLVGDTIRITNSLDNTILSQNSNTLGALKIQLL
jgi:hypothetical protein